MGVGRPKDCRVVLIYKHIIIFILDKMNHPGKAGTRKAREDIVIIGAGISSLVFCYLLCQSKSPSCPKLNVTVLEQTSRPGGRIHTLKKEGEYIDAGALRFSRHHKRLWGLIEELELTN